MSKTRKLFIEALNPLNKIANQILKQLNYIESSIIIKSSSFEEAEDFLNKTAHYHSNSFEDLVPEDKNIVLQKIYNRIHSILNSSQPKNSVEEADNTENLENKIYNFLKTNGGILYPLETSAKKLAKAIKEE